MIICSAPVRGGSVWPPAVQLLCCNVVVLCAAAPAADAHSAGPNLIDLSMEWVCLCVLHAHAWVLCLNMYLMVMACQDVDRKHFPKLLRLQRDHSDCARRHCVAYADVLSTRVGDELRSRSSSPSSQLDDLVFEDFARLRLTNTYEVTDDNSLLLWVHGRRGWPDLMLWIKDSVRTKSQRFSAAAVRHSASSCAALGSQSGREKCCFCVDDGSHVVHPWSLDLSVSYHIEYNAKLLLVPLWGHLQIRIINDALSLYICYICILLCTGDWQKIQHSIIRH